MKLIIPFMNVLNYDSVADPVFVATEEGQTESLKLLVENKFSVNRTTEYFRDFVVPVYSYLVPLFSKTYATPLCSATAKCRLELVKFLLDSGARATYDKSTTIFNPFLLAILRRHTPEILKEYLSHDVDINAISVNSLYQVPDAVLVGLHPLFHSQLLLMLKTGLKPSLKNWCNCRRSKSSGSLLEEMTRILLPSEIRDTFRLVIKFEFGLPNCCHLWQNALGESWLEFATYASTYDSSKFLIFH